MSDVVYRTPVPTNLDQASIERLAERISRDHNLAPGENMDHLVGRLGGRVRTEPSTPTIVMTVRKVGTFEVRVYEFQFTTPRRFDLARALGHYFLHFPLIEKPAGMLVHVNDMDPRVSWEARIFASALLVPGFQLRQVLDETRNIHVDAAERFGVGVDLIRDRARTLAQPA